MTNKLFPPLCVVIFKNFVVVMKLLLCVTCTSPSSKPRTKFCLDNVESKTMARQNMLYCLFSSQGDLLFIPKHFFKLFVQCLQKLVQLQTFKPHQQNVNQF